MRTLRSMALAMALSTALVAPALAASQVGQTNEFVDATGNYSFSLSLTPTAGGVGMIDVPPTNVTYSTSGSTSFYVNASGDNRLLVSATAGLRTSSGLWRADNAYGLQAPVTSDGKAYAGNYLGIYDPGSRGLGTLDITAQQRVGGKSSAVAMKSVQLLVGSVSAADYFGLESANFTGSEILAAAQKLGISAGNSGSYYVTLNALNGGSFANLKAQSASTNDPANNLEFAILDYSTTTTNYAARDTYVNGAFVVPGEGASPAPLPALGGTIPGVLAVIGALRLRRRRR